MEAKFYKKAERFVGIADLARRRLVPLLLLVASGMLVFAFVAL